MSFKEGEQVKIDGEDDWGVVSGKMEEDFEWVVDDNEVTVKASEEEPIYIVALESGGSKPYIEEELQEYDREPQVTEDDMDSAIEETELAEVYHRVDNPDSFEQIKKAKDTIRKERFASENLKDSYTDYPEAAVENAQMALDAREDTGNPRDCGTRTGWIRANQLANEEPLSGDVVIKMAQFNRHRSHSDMDDEQGRADCGWMMWKAWGGDEGVDWAKRKIEEAGLSLEEDELINIPGVDDPGVGFDSDPRGWDRSSYLDAWATVGGTWTSCFARMTLHFSPRMAKRWCAALKDTILGTEKWRTRF